MGIGFFLLRSIWAVAMWLVFLAPLNLVGRIDGRWIALLMAIVTLVYLAGADLLHLARWGAYVSLTCLEPPHRSHPDTLPDASPPSEIAPLAGLA
jgi:hypothetical protein